MSKASRLPPDPDLVALALEGEAEATRQRDLYARGLHLLRIYGNIDQNKDPLGFDLLTEAFDAFDVEAYLFTQGYLAAMHDGPGAQPVVQVSPAPSNGPAMTVFQPSKGTSPDADPRNDLLLANLIDLYVASRPNVADGSRMSDRAKCSLFLRVIELEINRPPMASDITNATMRAYAARLHHMPPRIRVNEPLTRARVEGQSKGIMSPKTTFSHAIVVKQFIHWLDDNKYAVDVRVLTILKPHLKKPKDTKPRVALTDEEAAALLTNPGKDTKWSADVLVPLLAAYTGARPGELCQLRCADIFEGGASSRPMLRITP